MEPGNRANQAASAMANDPRTGVWLEDAVGHHFYRTPDMIARDRAVNDQRYAMLRDAQLWKDLGGMAASDASLADAGAAMYGAATAGDRKKGREFEAAAMSPGSPFRDPRQTKMALLEAVRDKEKYTAPTIAKAAAGIPDYVMQFGTRPRDTMIVAAGEAAQGNFGKAAMHAINAGPSMINPSLAAGTPGSPTDWRPAFDKYGSVAGRTLLDFGTDPETWLQIPVEGPAAFIPAGGMYHAARGAGSFAKRADAFMDAMRWGDEAGDAIRALKTGQRGIRAELVDPAGAVVRRLRNAAPAKPIGIEYAKP